MTRTTSYLAIAGLALLSLLSVPVDSFAQKSCLDEFYVCYNDASAYTGWDRELAEAECSVAYTGCVVSKLKFW
jgi:hypothetical protein